MPLFGRYTKETLDWIHGICSALINRLGDSWVGGLGERGPALACTSGGESVVVRASAGEYVPVVVLPHVLLEVETPSKSLAHFPPPLLEAPLLPLLLDFVVAFFAGFGLWQLPPGFGSLNPSFCPFSLEEEERYQSFCQLDWCLL